MAAVYLLTHSYEKANGCDEVKIIGIFSNKEKAERVIEEYKKLPGFKEQEEGFCIDEYIVDKKHWGEGYCKV